MGLLLDHRHARRRARPRPGATSARYMAAVFDGPGALPRLGRAPDLPPARDEPGAGADLAALRRLARHLLGGLDRRSPTCSSASRARCRSTRSTSARCPRRSASTPPRRSSPTRTGRTTAARRRCRTSPRSARSPSSSSSRPAVGIAVAIAMVRGFSRRNSRDDRQLLGRHHPLHPLHPAADRLRRRAHLRRPGRGADPRRDRSASTTR